MAQEVKTVIPFPDLDGISQFIENGKAKLELSTDKYNDKIVSSAFVWYSTEQTSCTFTTQDFRRRYAQNRGTATQKALQRQHDGTFTPEAIEAIKAEVLAFYANLRERA